MSTPDDPNTDPLVIEAEHMKAFSDFVHSHRDPNYRRKRLKTWPNDPEAERIARLMLDSRQDFLIRLIRRAVAHHPPQVGSAARVCRVRSRRAPEIHRSLAVAGIRDLQIPGKR
jgi:hypothetical protein